MSNEVWLPQGTLVYSLRLPQATPSNNELRGMHHRVYRALRKQWCGYVAEALMFRRPKTPISSACLHIRRHSAGEGLDWDNAYGGLKPLLDCLVDQSRQNPDGLGLIKDDSPRCVPRPPYLEQLPAPLSQSFTEVFIYDLNATPR